MQSAVIDDVPVDPKTSIASSKHANDMLYIPQAVICLFLGREAIAVHTDLTLSRLVPV